ncbi:ferredoxin, 2Fe-2S [mine drainage metagenome]|uniref:Ferredoxin, 2Fe-2S n=1 Tax=mine drainage metagenome TaxID=410659 RepID=A0A1J5RCX4_9ZZZZ
MTKARLTDSDPSPGEIDSRSAPDQNSSMNQPVIKPEIGHYRRHLLVCTGTRCTRDGQSQLLFDSLGDKFKAAGLHEGAMRVKRSRVSCFAACKGGPILCVQPDGVWYYNVTPENMDRIVDRHLVNGQVVEDLVFHRGPACGVPEGNGDAG